MKVSQMQLDVAKWAKEKGWLDREVGLPEQISLIHSEVSEALESWRAKEPISWIDKNNNNKPMGVGSEFADIFIRILHYAGLLRVDMEYLLAENIRLFIREQGLNPDALKIDSLAGIQQQVAIIMKDEDPVEIPDMLAELHEMLSGIYSAWKSERCTLLNRTTVDVAIGARYGAVITYLLYCCILLNIDLQAEYIGKMLYNETRPYRHGGKIG